VLDEDAGGSKFAVAMDDILRRRCQVGRRSTPPAPSFQEDKMVITRKLLISFAVVVVALFAIANPLGDSHHGLGKHSTFYADLGQGVWVAFLIGAAAFVILLLIAMIQRGLRSRHNGH
jgi:ABC-type Fe3+ transport system permease subunit